MTENARETADDLWIREPVVEAEPRKPQANGRDPDQPIWIDDDEWDEAKLPLRPWVAPGYALRGAVTLVTGPPSAKKSSLMLAWGCAYVLGQRHGNFSPAGKGPAVIYNCEDNRDEQRRRLSAALRQFNAGPANIRGQLVRIGPEGIGTLFTWNPERGLLVDTKAMIALRGLLADRRPGLLIADPLAELHGADENDNTALRAIIAEFRALAVEFNMAVIVIHHTRKGTVSPGDPDSARGGSAIVGAARIVLTCLTMSDGGARRYTHVNAAVDRAAWKVVTNHVPSLNEEQARKLILTYVENTGLFSKTYDDPKDRKPRQGLYLNQARRPGAVH